MYAYSAMSATAGAVYPDHLRAEVDRFLGGAMQTALGVAGGVALGVGLYVRLQIEESSEFVAVKRTGSMKPRN